MLFAGIDWSDQSLEYHLRTGDGRILAEGRVRPDVAGLAELYLTLEAHASPGDIGIAIEAAQGAWVASGRPFRRPEPSRTRSIARSWR
jgi:hypothetical protein